jgi:Xaa-Pro aminopeptidase
MSWIDKSSVTRRAFLAATPTWVAATGTLAATGVAASAFQRGSSTQLRPGGGRPRLPGLPTSFSMAERDRRWSRVRAMMKREELDCLLTPIGTGGETEADSRYLTQEAGWVVFPLEGRVIAVVDGEDFEDGKIRTKWVSDVRPAERGAWSPPIIDALRELGMTRARLGVGRLEKVLRNHDGDVTSSTLDRVRQAFPQARILSAYEPLMRVKLVRGAEEIEAMRLAVRAGELGIHAMIETARPGVEHKDVWLATFTALTAATGESPSRLAIRAGNEANTSTGGPMLEVVQAGQIMNQEINARVLGYTAQVNHSICIGNPTPADWRGAGQYCIDLFHELVNWIRPGRSFMDLCRFYAEKAKARSPELSPTWVLVHTAGFGDGPRMGATRTETTDLMIEPSMVFNLKPRIVIKGTRPAAQFGDGILTTARGAERLGTRTLELVTTGG